MDQRENVRSMLINLCRMTTDADAILILQHAIDDLDKSIFAEAVAPNDFELEVYNDSAIEAVKMYRERTGSSLRVAHEMIVRAANAA